MEIKQSKLWRKILRLLRITINHTNIYGYFNAEKLYSKMVEKFPEGSKFVEVGSFMGKSTCYMAQLIKKKNKKISFDAIDTFEGSPEHQEMLKGTSLYATFMQNMADAGALDMITVKKAGSEIAAKEYRDESLDFVYIDAGHDYASVIRDINAWLPKVKNNGVLAGDDYHHTWQGVIGAVNEKFGKDNIEVIPNAQWVYYKNPG